MGVCFSSETAPKPSRRLETATRLHGGGDIRIKQSPPSNVIIGAEGKVHRYGGPVKAKRVVAENPNCFLSSSETMSVGSRAPHVPDDEDLRPDQIYFLLPVSRGHVPMTLTELCELAVRASSVLGGDAGEVASPATGGDRFIYG